MPNDRTRIIVAYFSATFSTKRVVKHIAENLGAVNQEIDLTNESLNHEVNLDSGDLLIVGVPVYGGRIPAMAAERLKGIKGRNTRAIIVCVYGNRDYDDALLELNDNVKANGFIPVAAAAVVAEHCIFPKVATGRPDAGDWQKIESFCKEVKGLLDNFNPNSPKKLTIKGKRPYKKAGGVPLHPSAAKDCNECGTCARQCPTGAISMENPRITDTGKCISCARCINVCPQHARKFRGAMYKTVGFMFVKGFSKRREPEFILG